jgi:uncharacterized coiled-coil DUF342 family protein
MSETTDLEKKSLEAHVDLCAQRYRFLEQKLDTVEEKILALNTVIREVHDMVQSMSEKRNDQLINWGVGIVGTLLAVIAYLVTTFVMP